jgi:hypothetical protein
VVRGGHRRGTPVEPPEGSRDIAGKVEHLFAVLKNQRTGEPYTNAEVARSSAGDLAEEEVEGIRTGRIPDPSVRQVSAFADVFGIASSWFLDREERSALLDEEGLEALRDEVAGAIVREVIRLPERERSIVLGIVRLFGEQRDESGGR